MHDVCSYFEGYTSVYEEPEQGKHFSSDPKPRRDGRRVPLPPLRRTDKRLNNGSEVPTRFEIPLRVFAVRVFHTWLASCQQLNFNFECKTCTSL